MMTIILQITWIIAWLVSFRLFDFRERSYLANAVLFVVAFLGIAIIPHLVNKIAHTHKNK